MGRRLVIISDVPGPDVSSALIEGRSLYRLTILMGLPHVTEVHKRYDARNLIPTPDPSSSTCRRSRIQAASEMLPSLIGAPVILLGNNVPTAFGLMPRPWCEWRETLVDVGARSHVRLLYATVPHPSSANRSLNDHMTMGIVTTFLRRVRDEEADGSLYERADVAAEEYARAIGRGETRDLLTVADVAMFLGCAEQKVQALMAKRRIGYMRLAGGPRFTWDHIKAYQAAYEVPMAEVTRRVKPGEFGTYRAVRLVPEVGTARGRIRRKKISTCAPGGTLRRTG